MIGVQYLEAEESAGDHQEDTQDHVEHHHHLEEGGYLDHLEEVVDILFLEAEVNHDAIVIEVRQDVGVHHHVVEDRILEGDRLRDRGIIVIAHETDVTAAVELEVARDDQV